MGGAAADGDRTMGDAERRRKMRALTGRFACRAMSQLLVRNVWDQLWLQAYEDVATQAIVRGQIHSASELLTFLLTPILVRSTIPQSSPQPLHPTPPLRGPPPGGAPAMRRHAPHPCQPAW